MNARSVLFGSLLGISTVWLWNHREQLLRIAPPTMMGWVQRKIKFLPQNTIK